MIRLLTPEEAADLRWSAKVNGLIQGVVLCQGIPVLLYVILSSRLDLSLLLSLMVGDGRGLALLFIIQGADCCLR